MKKTKIIATISDLKCNVDFLTELYESGVNAFRLNTAHQIEKDTLRVIKNIKKVSNNIPVILDTKGPEVRTTEVKENFEVKKGEKVLIKGMPDEVSNKDCIYVNYIDFVKYVPVGSPILYDDGKIEFLVLSKKDNSLVCEIKNSGIIERKKSMNVPGINLNLPSLTKKDKSYVEFSTKNQVDFIAHSFIRDKNDLIEVQQILDKHKSKIKLIAKIENKEGVENLDEILDHCAGIMVARGDLAIEIPAEKVPAIQKRIIKRCIERRKIVITATQMLHTMIENPRPTRAEINDVANAVYDGTDCLMLSGESAFGKYPLEAVKVMVKVAKEIENEKPPFKKTAVRSLREEVPSFLSQSAIRSAIDLPIKGIITDSLTGRTARYLSAFRGKPIIYALCYSQRVQRELGLTYGVYAQAVKQKKQNILIKEKVKDLISKKLLKEKDIIAVLTGSFGPAHGASRLDISNANNFLKQSYY